MAHFSRFSTDFCCVDFSPDALGAHVQIKYHLFPASYFEFVSALWILGTSSVSFLLYTQRRIIATGPSLVHQNISFKR